MSRRPAHAGTTPVPFRLNSRISLDDFKSIYYMEWAHRILGPKIGLAFVLPLGYFVLWHRLSRRPAAR